MSEAACRANITARNRTCAGEVCEQCVSECTYPRVRAVADVLKCTIGREQLGFQHCLQTSDAGQLARASHGAIRGDNYIAVSTISHTTLHCATPIPIARVLLAQVPENLAAHAHRICHNNPKGWVQRDSVSCRKEHRNSPVGHFVPGFDDRTGNPVARAGYMVPCKRSADCYTRCPAHPLTGDRFQCQKRYKLYDIARTNSDGEVSFLTLGEGDATAFDPDPEEQARTGEYGLCVDLDYSHQQGCKDKTLSAVMDGAIGCFDRQVSMFLCGLELNIMDGDASTATLEGNFLYDPPRMLVAAGPDLDGDGLASPEITCSDPSDCSTKCRMLERTSLHGAGAPPACAMCDAYCSSNLVSTVMQLVDAIWADVLSVARVLAVCFGNNGLDACMCQLSIVLQPKWRKLSTNPVVRCEDGNDPWDQLVKRVDDLITEGAENMINFFIDGINIFLQDLGWPFSDANFDPVCFPTHLRPDRCVGGPLTPAQAAKLTQCEDASRGLENMCYFARVRHICSNDDLLEGYDSLFANGYKSVDETQAEFARAFGESFEYLDPTMAELMRPVERSSKSGPALTARRSICSSNAFASAMSLDMVRWQPSNHSTGRGPALSADPCRRRAQLIISCVFANMEQHCPADGVDPEDEMEYSIEKLDFELPKVRFDFDVSPPPPPPVQLAAYEALVAEDPGGFAATRAVLEEIFPRLSDVSTSSIGATVGTYIADFTVTRQQLTRAYLASLGMVPDSLGARVIEAKHTGRWRPACKELHNFLNDRKRASAGRRSQAALKGNPHFNDDSHASDYDRNLLLYAMMEIKMS